MMSPPAEEQHIPDEGLVAYDEDALPPDERDCATAHLASCPSCQRRLEGFRRVARLLRAATPWLDDPEGQAALIAHLEREAGLPRWQQTGRRVSQRVPWPRALLGVKLVLLGGLMVLAWPAVALELGLLVATVVTVTLLVVAHHDEQSKAALFSSVLPPGSTGLPHHRAAQPASYAEVVQRRTDDPPQF